MTDAINLILAAVGGALATSSQSAISDTIKDELEALVKYIRKVLTSKSDARKSLLVLDEYRQDPDTWEKPLRDTLSKAGFAQDTTAHEMAQQLLTALQTETGASSLVSVQHHGDAYGSVNGVNLGTIVNTTHVQEDKVTAGMQGLHDGQGALQRGEYDLAISRLEKALDALAEKQNPVASAQVRALLTLALFRGKRPRHASYQTFCRATQLLHGASTLHVSWAYLYTLAVVKQDYGWNGHSHLYDEADELIEQVRHIPFTPQDQEYIDILYSCQPRLMQDAQGWWK